MTSVPWLADRGEINWPRLLLVGLVGAVLVGLVFFGATSTAAFGPFNPNWDGGSDFRGQIADDEGVDLTIATETSQYESVDPNATVAFVVAPEDGYGDRGAERVREFVEAGGTLVVMEDFAPTGNDLLAAVGADARIDGRLVRDEQNFDRAPTMPVATGVGNDSRVTGVDQLTLNYASTVEPNNATVLARTSEFAYLTESEEGGLDDDTDLGARPIATVESVGDGDVVVVSDPSITTNVMLDRPDNEAFLRGLYAGADQVVLDRSQSEQLPPLRRALFALRDSPVLQIVVGGLAIVSVGLVSTRRPSRPLGRALSGVRQRLGLAPRPEDQPLSAMSDEQREQYLRQQHPEWDSQRIERVITAFNQTDRELGDSDRND